MRTILIIAALAGLVGAAVWKSSDTGLAVVSMPNAEDVVGVERTIEVIEHEATPSNSRRETGVEKQSKPPAKSVYYQWVDERGSVHFAGSLDEVPAAWRSRAGQIQLDSAAFNRTAVPAAKPVRPRPIAEAAPNNRNHDVTIYTAPWCGWCRKTIAFLDQRGIDYVNKDIDEDATYADELREKSGGTAIPFVEIDGEAIRGFDAGRMTALLD